MNEHEDEIVGRRSGYRSETGGMRHIVKNTMVIAVVDLIGRGVAILTSPVLTRLLTPGQYGGWALLLGMTGMTTWLQYGGMDGAYPFFRAQARDDSENETLATTATVVATLACGGFWILVGAGVLATSSVEAYARVSHAELLLFLLGAIPLGLSGWYLYILRYMHQAIPFARLNLLTRVLGVLAAIPVMAASSQADRLGFLFVTLVVAQVIAAAWAMREFRRLGLYVYSGHRFSSRLARQMIRYGAVLTPGAVLYSISFYIGRLLVGWFGSAEDAALLVLGMTLGSAVLIVKGWVSLVWDPHVTEWLATKNPRLYLPRLQIAVGSMGGLFFLLAALAAVWSDLVIALLYPPFYGPVARLVPLVILTGSCSALSSIASATMIIAGAPRYQFMVYAGSLLVNIVGGVLLVPRLGALGAVLAGLASEACVLCAWIVLGRIVLKNLLLDWTPAALVGTLSALLIVVYRPGMFIASADFIERIVVTAGVTAMLGFVVSRYRVGLSWRDLTSFDRSIL
jgi:O-antigen/teichoic acid export membrane protein